MQNDEDVPSPMSQSPKSSWSGQTLNFGLWTFGGLAVFIAPLDIPHSSFIIPRSTVNLGP